jgi:hypothetical protein
MNMRSWSAQLGHDQLPRRFQFRINLAIPRLLNRKKARQSNAHHRQDQNGGMPELQRPADRSKHE